MRHSFGKSGHGTNLEVRWRSETAYFADREERVVSHREIQMLRMVVKEMGEAHGFLKWDLQGSLRPISLWDHLLLSSSLVLTLSLPKARQWPSPNTSFFLF